MRNSRKKLIEVALPLAAINAASAREKSIRHGHPSTLHLWWARRPLAACRAVLFAQLVDDPSSVPEEFPDEAAQEKERRRLFGVVERLVKWENSNDPRVIGAARREIARSVARGLGVAAPRTRAEVDAFLARHAPPAVDPFCGGGSIPLEAQRLGLCARGSDLNPVAVLITKALIEIPPRFAGLPRSTRRRKRASPRAPPGAARARKDSPRTCAITAAGCARKRGSGSAISTPGPGSRTVRRRRSSPGCGRARWQAQPGRPRRARAARPLLRAVVEEGEAGLGGAGH